MCTCMQATLVEAGTHLALLLDTMLVLAGHRCVCEQHTQNSVLQQLLDRTGIHGCTAKAADS
jgi:hypothetical protein